MQLARAIVRTVTVEGAPAGYNTIFTKIYYPATYSGTLEERNTGVLPATDAMAPFPVVLFLSGINVGKESYQWLAIKLAEAGIVTVTYDWIAEDLPGFISLTAGVDLQSLGPDVYGSRPTSTVVGPLLHLLEELQANSVLAGLLDLNNVFLGGHSAGATMAFQNARPDWFPTIKGAFGYAGHTMASTMFGYDIGTILPVQSALPIMIAGGVDDGVIAGSSHRYGLAEGNATAALERTFHEGITHGFLVLLKDAGHFVAAYPHDPSTGRGFLEEDAPDNPGARILLAALFIAFIHQNMGQIAWHADGRIATFAQK